MSKSSTNMLRTRRKDNNVKPNRRDSRLTRLDRKSSRGMIYENEELRLKTININAEIERGQYDIKKLKRENELLKKEIWCLRDEYDKLDKLLKDKDIDFSSSSSQSSSTSMSDGSDSDSCSSELTDNEVETTQNLENMKNLHSEFDHLSIVPEEASETTSERTLNRASLPSPAAATSTTIYPSQQQQQQQNQWNNYEIKPDQIYDNCISNYRRTNNNKASTLPIIISAAPDEDHQILRPPKHFFSPIKPCKSYDETLATTSTATTNYFYQPENILAPKSSTDLLVKLDNHDFNGGNTNSQSTFSNGGNLEELLNDIETISQDILKMSNVPSSSSSQQQQQQKPYKSELNVVLMPNPMPLLGLDKYQEQCHQIDRSWESLRSKSLDNLTGGVSSPQIESSAVISEQNPFFFGVNLPTHQQYFTSYDGNSSNNNNIENQQFQTTTVQNNVKSGSKTNLLELTSSEPNISSENDENLKFQTTKKNNNPKESTDHHQVAPVKSPKLSIRRKVSIHFKGKKDKSKQLKQVPTTPDENDNNSQTTPTTTTATTTITTPNNINKTVSSPQPSEKKSFFDIKFTTTTSNDNNKNINNKTSSLESKKSTNECGAATGSSRKSSSQSPERINNNNNSKHVHHMRDDISSSGGKKHTKKHKKTRGGGRRGTIISLLTSTTPDNGRTTAAGHVRERSFSICTDRSAGGGLAAYDDYGGLHSEYERTNSMSSCDETIKTTRKMSNISNIPLSGKVPWCACWGNGCL